MPTHSDIRNAVEAERDNMISQDLNPPVNRARDINTGFCLKFAENVTERLENPENVQLLSMGTLSTNHIWIEFDGLHYDSEAVDGVQDWRELPFWDRVSPPEDATVTNLRRENSGTGVIDEITASSPA